MNPSTNKLAIFFPGIGYHCDKPLLYYSRKLADEAGYKSILTLDYSLAGSNITGYIRGDKEKMQQAFHLLYEQLPNSFPMQTGLTTTKFSLYLKVSVPSLRPLMRKTSIFPVTRYFIPHFMRPIFFHRRMPLLFSALPIPGAILKK